MRKSVGATCVVILALGSLCSAAYAGCGNFDQLVSQSQALQAQFGDLSQPNCSSKPDESVVDQLISCFEGLSGEPARAQSQSDLQLSGLYGVITQCYRNGLGQREPGKKSFDHLVSATQADPSYEKAWTTFAETIAGMKQQGWFERKAIEIGLGISIDDELQTAIEGLTQLPQDASVSAELQKLRSL